MNYKINSLILQTTLFVKTYLRLYQSVSFEKELVFQTCVSVKTHEKVFFSLSTERISLN